MGKASLASDRQYAEVQAEHDEKHQRQPEIGYGQPKQGDNLPQAVPPRVQLDRRQYPQGDANGHGYYQGSGGKLEGSREPLEVQLPHRPVELERLPDVSLEDIPHKGEVLFRIGLVQAPLGPHPGQVFLAGAGLGIQPRRVPACYPHQAEDGDADYQEGNNAVKEAPYDELSHFTPSLSILPLPPGEG